MLWGGCPSILPSKAPLAGFGPHSQWLVLSHRLRAFGDLGRGASLPGRPWYGRNLDRRRGTGRGAMGGEASWQRRRADADGPADRLHAGDRRHRVGLETDGRAERRWPARRSWTCCACSRNSKTPRISPTLPTVAAVHKASKRPNCLDDHGRLRAARSCAAGYINAGFLRMN
jgi:hypothetical protein